MDISQRLIEQGYSAEDAAKMASAATAALAEIQQAQAPQQQEEQPVDEVAVIREKLSANAQAITDKEMELAKATSEFDEEKVKAIGDELRQLRSESIKLNTEALPDAISRKAYVGVQAQAQAEARSKDAFKLFPGSDVVGSPQNIFLRGLISSWESRNDARLNSANWEEVASLEAAKLYGEQLKQQNTYVPRSPFASGGAKGGSTGEPEVKDAWEFLT